jgi:hypothetical protein
LPIFAGVPRCGPPLVGLAGQADGFTGWNSRGRKKMCQDGFLFFGFGPRVTGLTDFSPIWSWKSFENYRSCKHIFTKNGWATFWPTFQFLGYFFLSKSYAFLIKKWVELHFGRLFHKLIRSPCSDRMVCGCCMITECPTETWNIFRCPFCWDKNFGCRTT